LGGKRYPEEFKIEAVKQVTDRGYKIGEIATSLFYPSYQAPKLLPNESEADFQSGLQSLLSELDNPSPLAVALVSQLNESLWWIRRHTVDKELLLHEAMARLLSKAGDHWDTYDYHKVSKALEHCLNGSADKDEEAWIDEILAESKLTLSDLRVRAFKDAARHIKMVDDLIHRQHQTIRHLQRRIDSIDYKSRLIKRMDLELAALESKQSAKGALTLDDKSS
jgi:transposase